MKPITLLISLMNRAIGIHAFLLLLAPATVLAMDISDVPLENAIVTAPPIVMFVFDNSGSMDLEVMTGESQGLFEGVYYVFPDDAYLPAPDHVFGAGHALSENERRKWRSQWSEYNHIYYSPRWRYDPWPSTGKHSFGQADLHCPASDPTRAGAGGARCRMASQFFSVHTGMNVIDVANAHYFIHRDDDSNGLWDHGETLYLVTWTDSDQDGIVDLSDVKGSDQRRYFRLADDGDSVIEDNELIAVIDEAEKNLIRPARVDASGGFQGYLTDKEELYNFVNWFTYYRRREFLAKAAVGRTIIGSGQISAGLYAVNAGPRMGARLIHGIPMDLAHPFAGGPTGELIDALYTLESKGSTPLRHALDQVGRYLHQDYPSELGPSPFNPTAGGGGCQRACAVVISDGFGNGPFSGIGNADGNSGKPYADAWADTLADVAMTYYEKDLGPNLPNGVPPTRCDPAAHQHMNTYTVALGYPGDATAHNAVSEADPTTACIADDPSMAVGWPQPLGVMGVEATPETVQGNFEKAGGESAKAALDDLRHAALNGRGNFLSAFSPMALTRTLPEVLSEMNEPACSADVAFNGMGVTDDSIFFQASYDTKDWSGEVSAYALDINTGQKSLSPGSPLWRASAMLPGGGSGGIWDQRRIVTYGGLWMKPQGVPFRYDQLSSGQRIALGSDLAPHSAADDNARDLVEYLRGRSFPKFRSRGTLLGDIVHGTPVLFGGTLFVGANDGQLHAFNAATGQERFSYVPNLIYGHLSALADQLYAYQHRYFVDGPLYAGEVMVGESRRNAYLVGGLGKGGKGYFCLLVGQRRRSPAGGTHGDYHWSFHVDDLDSGTSEEVVGDLVQWEYPRPDPSNARMDNDGDGFLDEAGEIDPDLGYSFSQAYAVNANCAEGGYRPVVIFGNGYESANQKALLYVLAADSGEIVRIIDTGAAGDNGLSTPALIDVDLDRMVDYAYAGDMNGNLWKFDLTADDPGRWGVTYGVDMNGDGVIDASHGDLPAPLFQAPGQPISGRPDVMVMHGSCKAQAPGFMVFFGTGRYLGATDRADVTQQSLFAVWDYGDDSDDSEHLGRLTDRDSGVLSSGFALYKKQIVGEVTRDGTASRLLSADDIDYALVEDQTDGDGYAGNNASVSQKMNPKYYAGWFFDFPLPADPATASGERVVGNAAIRGGKVIVPSYIPDNRPCGGGGRSWLYILKACNGDPPLDPQDEPIPSRGYQGKINDRPVVVKDLLERRKDVILFNDHAGRLQTLEMDGEKWGKVYWRQGP